MAKNATRSKVAPCLSCDGTMHRSVENRRYSELLDVVLVGVTVWRCNSCGEEEIEIPRIEELHSLLSKEVAKRPGRLKPGEIRWLRTHLGYSSVDFADLMGVTPETVSRWESKKNPTRMSLPAERLLRVLALQDRPVESYKLEFVKENETPHRLKLGFSHHSWKTAA